MTFQERKKLRASLRPRSSWAVQKCKKGTESTDHQPEKLTLALLWDVL